MTTGGRLFSFVRSLRIVKFSREFKTLKPSLLCQNLSLISNDLSLTSYDLFLASPALSLTSLFPAKNRQV